MGQYFFKLPDLGEGIVEAEVAALHVKVGDMVTEDQPLIDMMTDKATVEIPSPVDGKILSIKGQLGEMIAVGTAMVVIEVEGAGNTEPNAGDPAEKVEKIQEKAIIDPPVKLMTAPVPDPVPIALPTSDDHPLASPAVRLRALEAHIDLAKVPGSGPAGRISHQDIDDFIAAGGRISGFEKQKRTAIEEIPVIGIRRKIAQRMELSKRSIPHYSYVEEVDVTEVEKLRHFLNANRTEEQPKLSILPFIMMATLKGMEKFPECNSHYDPEHSLVRRFSGIHLGIASQTPNGLMVPVVSHAETLGIWGMAAEMMRVSSAARNGKAKREELSGSTVTITSLGKIGGIVTTPVINYPEVCIIGVNKIVPRPMVMNETDIQIRQMMNLSSSFDHRVVDGYVAAELIQYIKGALEQPATLFM
ncbi:Dihydrolipoamide acyltransferase component of branched-chain alpha-keto acid dehydrogenase complex [hydrothermal vent metagenome]|uniref:Dihydrolipoamide acyltransferase component of branched-chain alpha-keto acid dehydrogenase complex n=1 Tax=hydrothermal vent metagenome TaxID=652676 RepID=A0A3B1B3J2_9ZZZZ